MLNKNKHWEDKMATYRYCDVRKDLYDKCADMQPSKYRTIKGIKKILKSPFAIITLILILIAACAVFVVLYLVDRNFYTLCYSLISSIILITVTTVLDSKRNRIYNPDEREKELKKNKKEADSYVKNIDQILKKHGIVTPKQRAHLKSECEKEISSNEERYKFLKDKISNICIISPLGAFVSTIIYQNKGNDISILRLINVVLFGVLLILFICIIRNFCSDEYKKNLYLLNALNELEYLEKQ